MTVTGVLLGLLVVQEISAQPRLPQGPATPGGPAMPPAPRVPQVPPGPRDPGVPRLPRLPERSLPELRRGLEALDQLRRTTRGSPRIVCGTTLVPGDPERAKTGAPTAHACAVEWKEMLT